MDFFKFLALLCSIVLSTYGQQQSSTAQPPANVTSLIEKENDLKPVIDKPATQKLARQVVRPEQPPNPGSGVRYQGQPAPNPNYDPIQGSNTQPQLQPAYQRNPYQDDLQGRRLGEQVYRQPLNPNENPNSATRDLSRVTYYGRPSPGIGNDPQSQSAIDQGRRRIPYQGSSASDIDDQSFKPYAFNYIAENEEGMTSHQQRADSNGRVSGSYVMSLGDGRKRIVDYVADENGFRANVDTNEQGTSSAQSPADTVFYSSSPRPGVQSFPGSSNRQPQPNLVGSARDGYRSDRSNQANAIPDAGRSGSNRIGSRPNSIQSQFRTGREHVSVDEGTSQPQQQNPLSSTARSGRDDSFQAINPDVARNQFIPDSASRLNIENQNGQSNVLPRPYQVSPVQNNRNDNRDGDAQFQPNVYRPPLSVRPAEIPNDNSQAQPQDGRQSRTNRPSLRTNTEFPKPRGQPVLGSPEENSVPQTNDPRLSRRVTEGNEPSYYGWFRPAVRSSEENARPNSGTQRNPIYDPNLRSEENGLGYRPTVQDGAIRSHRQPTYTRSVVRTTSNDPSQDTPNVLVPVEGSQREPSSWAQPAQPVRPIIRTTSNYPSQETPNSYDPVERPQRQPTWSRSFVRTTSNHPSQGAPNAYVPAERSQPYPNEPSLNLGGDNNPSQGTPNSYDPVERPQRQPTWSRSFVRTTSYDPSQDAPNAYVPAERSQPYPNEPSLNLGGDRVRNVRPQYSRALVPGNPQDANPIAIDVNTNVNVPSLRSQPRGYNSFPSQPSHIPRTNTVPDESLAPPNRAILDEIPGQYRNYGTYWFYGH